MDTPGCITLTSSQVLTALLVAFSGFSEFDSSAWYPQPGAAPRHLRLFFFLWSPRKAFLILARILRGALLYSACIARTPQPDCRLINLLLTMHGALGGDWQGPCQSHGCLHIVQCHHRAKSNPHQSVSSVERPKKVSQLFFTFSKGKGSSHLLLGVLQSKEHPDAVCSTITRVLGPCCTDGQTSPLRPNSPGVSDPTVTATHVHILTCPARSHVDKCTPSYY